MSEAVKKHPVVDILINFASLRSAFGTTMEAVIEPGEVEVWWGGGRREGRELDGMQDRWEGSAGRF